MLASLRHTYLQLITSGGQLLLLFAGFHLGSPQGWLWTLSGIALLSVFAWYSSLYRYRMISGTPTSRIASAAQGYAELSGLGKPLATAILAKHSHLPCLWYRYKVERRNSRNKWVTESHGESDAAFLLDDDGATCVVDPRGAEIITVHKDTWQVADYRYTEWKLLADDEVYALGEFKTVGGGTSTETLNDLIKQVLYEWKLDNASLLKRFDLNGNGLLDMEEWMLARQAAKREAAKRLTQARAEPDTHFMLHPGDGRLYLLSNLPQKKLAGRYLLWTWLHLVIFFGALGWLAWLLRAPVAG